MCVCVCMCVYVCVNIAPVSGRAVTWSDTAGIGVRVYK